MQGSGGNWGSFGTTPGRLGSVVAGARRPDGRCAVTAFAEPSVLQFEPKKWSKNWSTAPHLPISESTPAGPSDCTKMLAHRFGEFPAEYPTLEYPSTDLSR